MAKTNKKVIIYSTPTCHYCIMAKDFFKENGIAYEAFDVQSDLVKRKEMISKSGQMGVPVIFVDDELVMGFDEEKLKKLLNVK
ncbi:MAG: glutaredoxin family protein [Candidatus Paceibacterota bacterium]|jgi:glutaredoxin-like YruB-family protein